MMRYFVSLFTDMSDMRRRYALRLAGRFAVLVITVLFCILDPAQFEVLHGWNFFRRFSWLHVLWGIWVIDMAAQILPLRTRISLGSQKMWHMRFRPIREMFNERGKLVAEGVAKLKKHIVDTTRSALWVLIVWTGLVAVIGALAFAGVMTDVALFVTAVVFYVCDLICVLIWCPFRLIMRNRCCTTCRIFNWDYVMICTPLMVLTGPLPRSACLVSIVLLLRWEITYRRRKERFFESANGALRCSQCQEQLCKYKRALSRKPTIHS